MTMLAPGTRLQDRYRVDHLIGQGGFGVVYEAVDERLDRRVALKQLVRASERLARQFEREAQLLANLYHPALPRVTDHFTTPAGQFLVMDFVPGADLGALALERNAPFPVEQVLTWGDQLLDALEYLHTRQPPIIHRDIKPQNLKLRSDGSVMLLDFGLAKGFAGENPPSTGERSLMAYTRGFAPPEQIEGLGTDARSDLYALAATLYGLVTNTSPVEAQTRMLAEARGRADPLRPAHLVNPEVSEAVGLALHEALELERERRPQSAHEMRALLRAARSGRIVPPRVDDASQPTILDRSTVVLSPRTPAAQPQPAMPPQRSTTPPQPQSTTPPRAQPVAPSRAQSAPPPQAQPTIGPVEPARPAQAAAPYEQSLPTAVPGAYGPPGAPPTGYYTPSVGETVPAPSQGMSRCVLSCLVVSLITLIGLGIGGWYAVRWGMDEAQRRLIEPAQQTINQLSPTVQAAQELVNAVPTELAGQDTGQVPTALAELANMIPTAQAMASSVTSAQWTAGPCEIVYPVVTVRAGPGVDYDAVTQLTNGASLQPLARNEDGSWVQVRFGGDAVEGWIRADEQFITCSDPVSSLPVGTAP